jgi:PAS domain S-box-containing protein
MKTPRMSQRTAMDPWDLGLDIVGMDGLVVLDSDYRVVYANPAACKLLGYTLHTMQTCEGDSVSTWMPKQEPRSTPERLAAGTGEDPVRWTAAIPRPDGSERDVECISTCLEVGGEHLIGVRIQDVSERRRQAREAAAIAHAAARVATGDGIEATLQALAEEALGGTRALGAAVWLDHGDERALWIGVAGLPVPFREGLRAALSAAPRPAGEQIPAAWRRVVAYHDARRRLESHPAGKASLAEVLKPLPWQAAVYAPLIYRRTAVGMLMAVYATGTLPSEEETTFLATLADQAALAAANAATCESPTLEERRRLERELHDSVAQALYGIALGASTARDLLQRDPGRLSQPIDYILQLAAVGLAEMRASMFEVRPESLETSGLVTALNTQIEALRVRHGIAAQPITSAEPDSPLAVKRALYRIAQGALRNVVKHARAGRVEVRLGGHDGKVILEVEDDGVGFEPGANPQPDLRHERERAQALGGLLEVVSAPGRGTQVRVSVPSRPAEPAGR